jgi:L-lactate dehydrogenase complex protein LldE
MDVQLFIPCFIDQLYPQTAFNTMKLLEMAGCKVHYNPEQTCCGQPAFNSGYWNEAGTMARKFLNDFSEDMPVVSPSASCSSFVLHHYPKILQGDEVLIEKHARLLPRIFELTDFLVNVLKKEDFGAVFPYRVTFHDACSALREYGLKDEARKLLANVEGLELVEMQERDTCCGFGGTFAVKHTDISSAMAEKKVEFALQTGAKYILSTESSCLMNLQGYIRKNKLPIGVMHIADVLVQGL